MPDKNDINYILGNLENIKKNFFRFFEDLKLELIKLKKKLNIPDDKNLERTSNPPSKFFNSFLKPLLEKNSKMTRKEILKECEKVKKYDSINTLNQYLPKLEDTKFIRSESFKREKTYMLN